MSHRAAVIRERNKLNVPSFPNVQPKPQPQQLRIEELVGKLMGAGQAPQWKIQTSKELGLVRILFAVGPIIIPMDFTPEAVRKFAMVVNTGADNIDPPLEMVMGPDGSYAPYVAQGPCLSMEDALAEAEAEMADNELGYVLAAEACTDSPE